MLLADLPAQLLAELPQVGEYRTTALRVVLERRHCHQSHYAHTLQRAEDRHLRGSLLGKQAELAGLAAAVELQQHLHRSPGVDPIEGSQQAFAIDGVDAVDQRQRAFNLVPLQVADEVPADSSRQQLGLAPQLLWPV